MVLVKALAYSSSANLGAGFDVMALAHDAYRDVVYIDLKEGRGSIRVISIEGRDSDAIPLTRNTGLEAAKLFIDRYGIKADVKIRICKGIPVGMGLGSSGATASAVVKGIADALCLQIPIYELIEVAGNAEEVAAGSPHYDNVAASLMGHLTILHSINPIRALRYDVKTRFILSTPDIVLNREKTRYMREILPDRIPLKKMVENTSKALALLIGILNGDSELMSLGMEDPYIDSIRMEHIPGLKELSRILSKEGLGPLVLSGAGPSLLIP